MSVVELKARLAASGDRQRAELAQRYFKTGPGEYAEGDIFLGIDVPTQRAIAKQYYDLSLTELSALLASPIHEHRFCALVILVRQYQKGDEVQKKAIFDFYLANWRGINNWDLVDVSAPKIVGEYLWRTGEQKALLRQLAASRELWQRRIAMLATAAFISHKNYQPTLEIAEMLLFDKHDLIHKAVGWMLREVGKADRQTLIAFLDEHHRQMARTTLRYALEKFDPKERVRYMLK